MPTHQLHLEKGETYFITFTCYRWLPLIEQTELYPYFHKWFDYLDDHHVLLLGYVLMPNHVHLLLHQNEDSPKTLNTIVANGKRFLAYEIIKRLRIRCATHTLATLKAGVAKNEQKVGKQHQVFRLSFGAKRCFDLPMLHTKLNYIHANPVSGKWRLVDDWRLYEHSSAGFYELDQESDYLTHYEDVW